MTGTPKGDEARIGTGAMQFVLWLILAAMATNAALTFNVLLELEDAGAAAKMEFRDAKAEARVKIEAIQLQLEAIQTPLWEISKDVNRIEERVPCAKP